MHKCTFAISNRFELLSARLSTNETIYKLTGDFWGLLSRGNFSENICENNNL